MAQSLGRDRSAVWRTYRVYTPAGGVQDPSCQREFLTVLWGRALRSRWSRLLHGQPWVAYEVRGEAGDVQNLWSVPEGLDAFLRDSLALYRPGTAEPVELDPPSAGEVVCGAVLYMKRPACYAVAERPLGAALARTLGSLRPGETGMVQFLLMPQHDAEWRPQAHEDFRRANGTGQAAFDSLSEIVYGLLGASAQQPAKNGRMDAIERHQLKDAPAKLKDHSFQVTARALVSAPTEQRARSLLQSLCAQFALLDDANHVRPKVRERAHPAGCGCSRRSAALPVPPVHGPVGSWRQ